MSCYDELTEKYHSDLLENLAKSKPQFSDPSTIPTDQIVPAIVSSVDHAATVYIRNERPSTAT